MATMNRRTTFALDATAIERLKRLSSRWRVSQAEVMRRTLEQADSSDDEGTREPLKRLAGYHAAGGLAKELAEPCIAEVHRDRSTWRGN